MWLFVPRFDVGGSSTSGPYILRNRRVLADQDTIVSSVAVLLLVHMSC